MSLHVNQGLSTSPTDVWGDDCDVGRPVHCGVSSSHQGTEIAPQRDNQKCFQILTNVLRKASCSKLRTTVTWMDRRMMDGWMLA